MRFTYCPHCGGKLILKEIGDEGMIPYCEHCRVPLWDSFSTCVICAVVNEFSEIALLRQDYVSLENYVCIAGYMKPGESAEDTARREVEEETGLTVTGLQYIKSWPYEKKDLLMLGFLVRVKKDAFRISGEVDSASWFPLAQAADHIRTGSIAWQLVNNVKEII